MQFTKFNHPSWGEAVLIRRGELELILVAGDYPRIASFRRANGDNILFDDVADAFGRGPWRLMGGHRLWIAPESEACYESEFGSCRIEIDPDRVSVRREPGPSLISRRIEISESDRCDGFRVRHEIVNVGGYPSTVAPWAITCVKPVGRVIVSWGVGADTWRMQTVRYWRQWGPLSTDPNDGQWQPQKDRFIVESRGLWGKIGLASEGRAVAHLAPTGTFIKHFDFIPGAAYPDDGCNISICNSPAYTEIETLGPLTQLAGGAKAVHDEHWDLAALMTDTEVWEAIQKK